MGKSHLVAFAVLSIGIAHAQQPDDERLQAIQAIQKMRQEVRPAPQQAALPVPPVINLGDVVANVVIAKIVGVGADSELAIAKFGGKEANATPRVVTTMRVEKRQREVIVNGEKITQEYNVTIPVTTAIATTKENFTPTEQDRSIPISKVQAFDLKGSPLGEPEWTKRLASPQHAILLREPINETNKLNPFYSAILREDILLLFLKADTSSTPITLVYSVKDLSVWSKEGRFQDPNQFIDLIKSKVINGSSSDGTTIRLFQANQSLLLTANQKTHDALTAFLRDMRDEIAKEAK